MRQAFLQDPKNAGPVIKHLGVDPEMVPPQIV
jgi:hypothetical protein